MGGGLEVTENVVVRQRHQGRRQDVRGQQQLGKHAASGWARHHLSIANSARNPEPLAILHPVFPVSDVIPSRSTPVVTLGLIAANAALFVYELTLPDAGLRNLFHTYGVIPGDFVWISVITSAFLHAGWLQFLGNMLYLWIFGDNVEDRLGHSGFLAFYLGCGAVAALGHAEVNAHSYMPMVGASGAIAGVMGAYFVLYPQSRVLTAVFLLVYLDLIEIPALIFLGVWCVMQFFSNVGSIGADAASGASAFAGYFAGFAFGALIGAVWRGRERRRQELWQ